MPCGNRVDALPGLQETRFERGRGPGGVGVWEPPAMRSPRGRNRGYDLRRGIGVEAERIGRVGRLKGGRIRYWVLVGGAG